MPDPTTPTTPQSPTDLQNMAAPLQPTLSLQEVDELQRKILANKTAIAEGLAPPYVISIDDMKKALQSLRRNRSASPPATKASSAKTPVQPINLDGL